MERGALMAGELDEREATIRAERRETERAKARARCADGATVRESQCIMYGNDALFRNAHRRDSTRDTRSSTQQRARYADPAPLPAPLRDTHTTRAPPQPHSDATLAHTLHLSARCRPVPRAPALEFHQTLNPRHDQQYKHTRRERKAHTEESLTLASFPLSSPHVRTPLSLAHSASLLTHSLLRVPHLHPRRVGLVPELGAPPSRPILVGHHLQPEEGEATAACKP